MDKYQQAFLDNVYNSYKAEKLHLKNITSKKSGGGCGEIDVESGVVTLNQEKDVTSTVYTGYIPAFYEFSLVFKSAYISYGGEWREVPLTACVPYDRGYDYEKLGFKFDFDFDNRITQIKLCIAGGVAEDLVLNVVYNEADKDAYYKAKALAERKALIDGANIQYNGCVNFLAVYFTPTNADYAVAEMDLYWGKDKFMATYKSVPQNFSITAMGLGQGNYNFVFRQKDNSGKIIFETDKIPVTVKDVPERKIYVTNKLPDC